jgi:hypothetical protein
MRSRIIPSSDEIGTARMPIDPGEAPVRDASASGGDTPPHRPWRPDLMTLWIIVSTFWTIATGLRIHHVWVPALGWPAVLGSAFTWVDLLAPPATFALVLWGIRRI